MKGKLWNRFRISLFVSNNIAMHDKQSITMSKTLIIWSSSLFSIGIFEAVHIGNTNFQN